MKVVASGYFVGMPMAGFFWHAVSFVLGFADAGHEVWYIEDSGDHPSSFDFDRMEDDPSGSYGIRQLSAAMDELGLGARWAYRHIPTGMSHGLHPRDVMEILAEAEVFVNVSMTTARRSEYERIPHRVAIDTDPVFTQIRARRDTTVLDWHTRLFTFGRPPLPAQRREDDWIPTRQPVASRRWAVSLPAPVGAPFTTVTSWASYDAATWNGATYGPKAPSLRAFANLPRRTSARLAMVLGGGGATGASVLREGGWTVLEPFGRSIEIADYRRFLASSAGEIGFAKHGYVAAKSGWFSDRTCCFLASGRPAVCQDTGWSDWLPTGDGLFSFTTIDEAIVGLEAVAADPARHSRAARRVAEEHFDAATVCTALLDAL
jgi:hypothetical protein